MNKYTRYIVLIIGTICFLSVAQFIEEYTQIDKRWYKEWKGYRYSDEMGKIVMYPDEWWNLLYASEYWQHLDDEDKSKILSEKSRIDQKKQELAKQYQRNAEQGSADAQNCLGFMYENGVGVSKDYGEALKWYRKSAERGNADAQKNLNRIYIKIQDFR
ncbi:MAG: sel1 repeat family protein [Prevotellaceae bacterium]|jgi:TPR repeat protein|nr:sel1 repeat family protein [Prevotellaceae bacterium]